MILHFSENAWSDFDVGAVGEDDVKENRYTKDFCIIYNGVIGLQDQA